MEAQCWICPICFDDHGYDESACKPEDLKQQIEKLKGQVKYWSDLTTETQGYLKIEQERRKEAHKRGFDKALSDVMERVKKICGLNIETPFLQRSHASIGVELLEKITNELREKE
jgi:hypothetical protein